MGNDKLSVSFYIYIKNILSFVNSILIKSDYIKDRYNQIYNNLSSLDIEDSTTFPYYQNICGNYCDINESMELEILDNLTISIDKTTIKNNNEYKDIILNDYDVFKKLLVKYPNQNILIKGIFYNYNDNYNINDIIKKDNYSLIACNLNYLDEQEREYIYIQLKDFLEYYNYRWYINTFNYEELYGLLSDAMLWILLPLVILYYKIINIKTSFTDDFNIWNYLISKGMRDLEEYFTKYQSLYFYRNINYLTANRGKISIYDKLDDIILKPLKYKLEKLFIKHFRDNDNINSSMWYSLPIFSSDYYKQNNKIQSINTYNNVLRYLYDNKYNDKYDIDEINKTEKQFNQIPYNRVITKYQKLNIVANIDYKYYLYYLMFILDNFVILNKNNKIDFTITLTDYMDNNKNIYINTKYIIYLIYWITYKNLLLEPINLPIKHTSRYGLFYSNKTDLDNDINNNNKIIYNDIIYKYSLYDDLEYIKNNLQYFDDISIINNKFIFTDYIEKNYKIFKYLILSQRYDLDYIRININMLIYKSIFKEVTIDLDPIDDWVTYNDFFTNNPYIFNFIDKYKDNTKYYNVILFDIFESLCEIDQIIRRCFFLKDFDKRYKKEIINLFNRFNSYLVKTISDKDITYTYIFNSFNHLYTKKTIIKSNILYPSKGTIFKFS